MSSLFELFFLAVLGVFSAIRNVFSRYPFISLALAPLPVLALWLAVSLGGTSVQIWPRHHALELPSLALLVKAAIATACVVLGWVAVVPMRDRSIALATAPLLVAAGGGFMLLVLLAPLISARGWGAYEWAYPLAVAACSGPLAVALARIWWKLLPSRERGAAEIDGSSARVDRAAPTRDFASVAGMQQLKADLAPVLQQFRAWSPSGKGAKASNAVAVDRNGILFTGPPGNGKSMMAEAVAGELKLPLLRVGTQDLTSKWVNESAEKITTLVTDAINSAPCVLFIDEIDAIAPRRDRAGVHQEDTKVVNTLLQQIDRLRRHPVLLVAATNHLANIDPAIMRDGRFDFRIEIPWPDTDARHGILTALAAKHGVQLSDELARKTAARWERRSAAFIENVVKRLRDSLSSSSWAVDLGMVMAADRAVSRRSGNIPGAGLKLQDLYLLPDVRRQANSIVTRLAHWDEIAEQGGTPPRGILLYGPPGTGKTSLVNAMARTLGDWHVFEVKTSEILADPRSFDKLIELATTHRPAFVFIDEADDLLKDRSSSFNATATNEILKAIDGAMGAVPEVVFVAATNNADAIDAAAKRSGRFGEKLFFDILRGEHLVEFIAHYIEANSRRLRLDADVDAVGLATCIGAAGPADVIGVLNSAVNATFADVGVQGERRTVLMVDVERAVAQLHSR
ncbi:ATP-binding protein [Roseateles asaccharophilus]|uniref:Transitional endoplasmic reticulum ATPase n=1 Tax=Roseateles asaccharophilus TaxID=582607 RepID=A0ABU2ADK8_9BURK|nr:ATP-binding protein [Roseateles asaccharophilus]MDR7334572.1 transitional endoplasmic reticulum ATPase [Roseateles asaccharophilus]